MKLLLLIPLTLPFAACASVAADDEPDAAVASIRVAGFVESAGITWLGWPNRVSEVLEGLPGVSAVEVDLFDDRFDVTYDPSLQDERSLAAAVRDEGFAPDLVETPNGAGEVREVAGVDVASFDDDLRAVFAAARAAGQPIVLDFWAPGWGVCEQMDAVTYPATAVRTELASWIQAKVDVSRATSVATMFDVPAVPVQIAVAPDGRVLDRVTGFASPREFAGWLRAARTSYEASPVSTRGE